MCCKKRSQIEYLGHNQTYSSNLDTQNPEYIMHLRCANFTPDREVVKYKLHLDVTLLVSNITHLSLVILSETKTNFVTAAVYRCQSEENSLTFHLIHNGSFW